MPSFQWRGAFTDAEVNRLHSQAFGGPEESSPWNDVVGRRSVGWVVARTGDALVGFVNVPTDGLAHAWLQDTMVAPEARGRGIGTALVALARDGARDAGCRWLHVDYESDLAHFYEDGCGFTPTRAGLLQLGGPSGRSAHRPA